MNRTFESRLPLLASLLVVLVLGLFLTLGFIEVRRTLIEATQSSARASATQVVGTLAPLVQRRAAELRRVAAQPSVVGLAAPGAAAQPAVIEALVGATSGPQTIQFWRGDGTEAFSRVKPSGDGATLPPMRKPQERGTLALAAAGRVVYARYAVDVPGGGLLLVQRPIQISPANLFNRLVGGGARVLLGNAADDVWTDFTGPAAAPNTTSAEFLTEIVPIAETPWVMAVELPRGPALQRANAFLRRMLIVGAIFLSFAIAAILSSAAILKRGTAKAERDLESFFELSIDLYALANPDGLFHQVNDAWTKTLGWSRGDVLSRPFLEFVHPDDRARTEAEAARLFTAAPGTLTIAFENRYRHANGTYRWISWNAFTGQGGAIYAAGRDVTETKCTALALQGANAAKSAFLSRMSHDLRTPLNSILGFAQLLQMGTLQADQREFAGLIVSGGRHLLQLINEVLDISRIEAGQLSLSIEPIRLSEVIDEVVALVQPLAAPNQVTISRRIEPGSPDAALADRPRLNQILMNLVSNAVKYNRAGGTVEISVVSVRNNRVRIDVRDTGMGIAADKRALVFKPFERLGAEASGVEGTGLGLAVARGLAEAMGGTIDFDSMEGRGSTFWIELALATDPPRTVSAPPELATPVPGSRATVLYIEDNPSNVLLVKGLLRQRPFLELRHAPTAAEGLALARAHRPDLVLLDLHLPDASGEVVLRDLRADPATRTLPVIVATADATPETARRITELGADAFLAKPLDVAQVLVMIDGMLKR